MAKETDWDALRALFLRYRAGDSSVVDVLFKRLAQVVQGYYFTRTRESMQSEDLAQACLLKIHLGRDRFDADRSLKTWVFTIAERTLIDHWRGAAHEATELVSAAGAADDREEGGPSWLDSLPSPDLLPELKVALNQDLNQALALLKPIDRQIVYLYAVEEFSMAEIGDVLDLTESAVKVRAHRSYVKLRKELHAGD